MLTGSEWLAVRVAGCMVKEGGSWLERGWVEGGQLNGFQGPQVTSTDGGIQPGSLTVGGKLHLLTHP